jgi:ferredoxin
MIRKIVLIDEDKCNGCGECILACAESALQIVNGKAKLINDQYCDGLGACLGECPQGAITIAEREAAYFDEEATRIHMKYVGQATEAKEKLSCGCSSNEVYMSTQLPMEGNDMKKPMYQQSKLSQWPVKLALVPPDAPFLNGTDLLLAADCVPFAYTTFHQDFLNNHSLLVACPKLDDFQSHLQKLTEILNRSRVKSITVLHMEVPCCSGLVLMAKQAIHTSSKDIQLKEITVGTTGGLK